MITKASKISDETETASEDESSEELTHKMCKRTNWNHKYLNE